MVNEFIQLGTLIGGVMVLKLVHKDRIFWLKQLSNSCEIAIKLYQDYKEEKEIALKKKQML